MNLRHRAAAAVTTPSAPSIREDCWSEPATAALIDSWGSRFLLLNRGNLRQKDWQDVSDSVNQRQVALASPTKSSAQCKNRIDTLKKKYKIEKSKPGTSPWRFFSQLDFLLGVEKSKAGSSVLSSWGSSRVRTSFVDERSLKVGGGFGEIVRAVEKVGEIYERVERLKLEQRVELERRRMEFEKEVEMQRMKLFMETQVELVRIKWRKRDSDSVKGHSRSLSEAYKL